MLVRDERIHIALDDHHLPGAADALARQIQAIERGTLVEDGRLRCVEVLRMPAAQLAPAEGDGLAAPVADGEDQAIAEVVVQPATLAGVALARDTGLDQLLRRIVLLQ